MKKYIYQLSSILIAVIFITLAFGSDDSESTPEEQKEEALKGVRFSGRTANIDYEIEDGTWLAQDLHEELILEKIYYIFMEGKADKINITMYDYCKDNYGHNNRRAWHKTIDKTWHWWDDAYKYSDAKAYSNAVGRYYTLSSETEEGAFYCCGRDRGCH